MAQSFRKRPVVVQAMRFVGDPHDLLNVYSWVERHIGAYNSMTADQVPDIGVSIDSQNGDLLIMTLEGEMRCMYGDWVIRGIHGEFYPCKADIFDKTYELIEEDNKDEIPEMIEELRKVSDKPLSPYQEMVQAIDKIEQGKRKPNHE